MLAHSLRDSGTSAKLVALFTPESLRPATIDELKVFLHSSFFFPFSFTCRCLRAAAVTDSRVPRPYTMKLSPFIRFSMPLLQTSG